MFALWARAAALISALRDLGVDDPVDDPEEAAQTARNASRRNPGFAAALRAPLRELEAALGEAAH
eukprot:gene7119-4456_t